MEKRKARKIPETLTEKERKALLDVPGKRYPTGVRNRAMMFCMFDAGLRLNQVDWNIGKLRIENA